MRTRRSKESQIPWEQREVSRGDWGWRVRGHPGAACGPRSAISLSVLARSHQVVDPPSSFSKGSTPCLIGTFYQNVFSKVRFPSTVPCNLGTSAAAGEEQGPGKSSRSGRVCKASGEPSLPAPCRGGDAQQRTG